MKNKKEEMIYRLSIAERKVSDAITYLKANMHGDAYYEVAKAMDMLKSVLEEIELYIQGIIN